VLTVAWENKPKAAPLEKKERLMTADFLSSDQLDQYHQFLREGEPGAAIRLLRERKGISIEDITRATLIPDWKLSDLENDDYAGLGASIFVVGYIRKIAKLLEVDSDPIVDAFKSQLPEESSEESEGEDWQAQATVAKPKAPRIPKISGIYWIAGLLVIWAGAVFWLKADREERTVTSAPQELVVPEVPESTADIVPTAPPATMPVATAEPAMTADNEDAQPELSAEFVESDAVAETQAPVPDTEAPAVTADSPIAPETTPVPMESFATNDGDLLVMTFVEDCWVEITDATGEVVFAQLQRTGDNLQLFGEAPFKVMLGNARAADVSINGKTVPISPIPGRDTLRFTVEP